METTCMQHESISRNTSLIPKIVADLGEIKDSLIGTMEKPGWIGRVALLEKESAKQEDINALKAQMGVVMRVAWGGLGIVGVALIGALLSLILK